ncbi:MAG: urease accessory protein UreD [Pseudomonadota bacterium]
MNAHAGVPRDASEAKTYALDLSVDIGPDGESRMTRHRVAFPWSLGRAFPAERAGGPLRILPQVAGAGLLSGDMRRQRVRVGAGAAARIEDAGAIVAHRGAHGPAAARWRYDLAAAARLTLAAEPYALSPGASLSLQTEIVIDPAASFLGFEGVCLAGEGPASWRSETIVRAPDWTVLLVDRQRAEASDYARFAALPGKPAAFGSFLLLAPSSGQSSEFEAAASLCASISEKFGAYAAAAPLRGGVGVGVRLAAAAGGDLRRAAIAIMAALA